MKFEDACFGQKVKVLSGPHKGRFFMIEDRSLTTTNGVVVADNEAEYYLDFSCDNLELLSPSLNQRLLDTKPLSQSYYDA